MSRSFRNTDSYQEKRAMFADRQNARADRRAEFEALGYDDPDAMADLPIHGARKRERARQALNR